MFTDNLFGQEDEEGIEVGNLNVRNNKRLFSDNRSNRDINDKPIMINGMKLLNDCPRNPRCKI